MWSREEENGKWLIQNLENQRKSLTAVSGEAGQVVGVVHTDNPPSDKLQALSVQL